MTILQTLIYYNYLLILEKLKLGLLPPLDLLRNACIFEKYGIQDNTLKEYFINRLKRLISNVIYNIPDVPDGPITPIDTSIVIESVLINNGNTATFSTLVNIDIVFTGIPSYYKISEDIDLLSTTEWIIYTQNNIPVILSEGDGIKTVYVQLRNNISLSNIESDTILLDTIVGIKRTDSLFTYNTFQQAINSVIEDYPEGLTQDVTIYTTTQQIEPLSSTINIMNFNYGGRYSLVIDGSEITTFNALSNGAFVIYDSDNIVLQNFNIYGVSNNWNQIEVPSGIKVKTTIDNTNISRFEIRNVNIDGRNWDIDSFTDSALGAYGISVGNVNSLIIDKLSINYFAGYAMQLSAKSIFIKRLTTGNSTAYNESFAHPTLLSISNCSLFVMLDSDFNAEGMTNGISFTDTLNIIVKRVIFRNCPSQLIEKNGISKILTASFESCIFYNNLINQYYYWTRGLFSRWDCEKFSITNCTIRLNPINNNWTNPVSKFIWTGGQGIDILNLYNNIYYYNNPSRSGYSDNGRGMQLVDGIINTEINSDNNLYYDYSIDANNIANQIFSTNLITTSSLVALQAYGCDTNSVVKSISTTIFESDHNDYNMFKLQESAINLVGVNLLNYVIRDIDSKSSQIKVIGALKYNQEDYITTVLVCNMLNLYYNNYIEVSGVDQISIASEDEVIFYTDDLEKDVYTEVEILDQDENIIHNFKQLSYVNDLVAKFINGVYSDVNYYSINIKKQ